MRNSWTNQEETQEEKDIFLQKCLSVKYVSNLYLKCFMVYGRSVSISES